MPNERVSDERFVVRRGKIYFATRPDYRLPADRVVLELNQRERDLRDARQEIERLKISEGVYIRAGDRLSIEVARLREALEWYEDADSYQMIGDKASRYALVLGDEGRRARQALAPQASVDGETGAKGES